MGYTTEFEGRIEIEPALNADEIAYLLKFSDTRRMDRENGPYFVDGNGFAGQGNGPDEVYNHSKPHSSQPGLWCKWAPTEDGTALEWNEHEKFYDSAEWMQYLIDHFIGYGPKARDSNAAWLPILQGHVCNGVISAQGEEPGDAWLLIVKDNQVFVQDLVHTTSGDPVPVATSTARAISAPLKQITAPVDKADG